MKIEEKGTGNSKIAIIGGIHGDEPCGYRAISRIIEKDLEYKKTVKFIKANEKAIEKNRRYIEKDLNRSFPGDINSEVHEQKLAAELLQEIKDCEYILSLHSTQSTISPFALINEVNNKNRNIIRKLPLKKVVSVKSKENKKGDLISILPESCIELECGYQKSRQAEENAVKCIEYFLKMTNAIDKNNINPINTKTEVLRIFNKVLKQEEIFFIGNNFERINSGEIYGIGETGKIYRAEEPFYPILMSTSGYSSILGYQAKLEKCLF